VGRLDMAGTSGGLYRTARRAVLLYRSSISFMIADGAAIIFRWLMPMLEMTMVGSQPGAAWPAPPR
jgi:hypothetical protein